MSEFHYQFVTPHRDQQHFYTQLMRWNLTALGERTLVQLRGGYIGGNGWDTAERQGAKTVTNRYSLGNKERGGQTPALVGANP
jgi:hypothetical protein